MAAASSPGLAGGTFSPVSPCATVSARPPVSETTTGAPAAMASRAVRPKGS